MNLFRSPIKLCRIKLKIKGGEETFLDCIKRLDVLMQTRGPRKFKQSGASASQAITYCAIR